MNLFSLIKCHFSMFQNLQKLINDLRSKKTEIDEAFVRFRGMFDCHSGFAFLVDEYVRKSNRGWVWLRWTSTITCRGCGVESVKAEEDSSHVVLRPDMTRTVQTLENLMMEYTAEEPVVYDHLGHTEHCPFRDQNLRQGKDATKRSLRLTEEPDVLVLNLARFSFLRDGNLQPFPVEIDVPERLSIEHLTKRVSSSIYRQVAVVRWVPGHFYSVIYTDKGW